MTSFRPATIALGIDVGTSNTKVSLIEVHGGEVTELAVLSRPTAGSGPELLRDVMKLMRDALAAAPRPPATIGIAAMGETGTLLASGGGDDARALEAVGPLLRWNAGDEASDRAAAGLTARFGAAELYAATGVPAPAKTPLVRLLAMRRTGERGRLRWAGVAELVAHALTGELATDHTLAQRSSAFRLPSPGQAPASLFDAELLAVAGMSQQDMPRVALPGHPVGIVQAAAAHAAGVPAGIPVFVAGHDHAVGAWAAGVRAPGEAADSVGTAEALVRLAAPGLDREAARAEGMSIGRDVAGREELLLAGNPTAGGLLVRLLPDHDLAALAAAAPDGTPPAPTEPLLLPYPRGRQAPSPDTAAALRAVRFDGSPAELPTEPSALLRAAHQGLALQLRWMDTAQSRVVGRSRSSRLTVFGGPGAADEGWLALKRAALPGAIALVTAREPVASGAALLAAVRAGLADPAATLAVRELPDVTSPDFDGVAAGFVRAALQHVRIVATS